MENFESPKLNSEQKQEIVKRLQKKRDFLYSQANPAELHQKFTGFAKYLQSKYPDAYGFRLFHTLISSGPDEAKITNFDFPGDDSVEKFIDYLGQEYGI